MLQSPDGRVTWLTRRVLWTALFSIITIYGVTEIIRNGSGIVGSKLGCGSFVRLLDPLSWLGIRLENTN